MKRDCHCFLLDWFESTYRKPLVLRGARQVGKTWLVRNFAELKKLELLELNFEKRPDFASLFSSNDPKEIVANLNASLNRRIDPKKTLLFLDEIQTAPKILAKLRWFAEDMPQLAVIVAGSLLDFALAKHEFSMPVGRISYMYLEPFSFEEFLNATEKEGLKQYLESFNLNNQIPEEIHHQLIKAVKEYMVVGGMPAAVAAWIDSQTPARVNQIHQDLLSTYRDDFSKYSGRLDIERIEEVMAAIPKQLGEKFVYSQVNCSVSSSSLKQALELLTKARVCHQIDATAANGLPMGAEKNERYKKVIMLDCGLCGTSLGLSIHQLNLVKDLILVNKGAMAEQFVGQALRSLCPAYQNPSMYYWQRTDKGSSAEVDYLIQHRQEIIPIEVKAGKTGTLKSLHQFMHAKEKKIAVRINSDFPSFGPVRVKTSSSVLVEYNLLSIPFYLLSHLPRLLDSLSDEN